MSWRVAGAIAGTVVVLTLAVVGYLAWRDSGVVASHVTTFEGAVDVKSCERKAGEAITNDEYGAKLDEVWRCDVKRRNDSSAYAESCYVFYEGLESGIVRSIRCAAVGAGCPAGGSGDRDANGRFLGWVIDPMLVLEEERGSSPPFRTIRAFVHREAAGARERCGYLNVRVPVGDDPLGRAAEQVEASGFSAPRYSLTYSVVGG